MKDNTSSFKIKSIKNNSIKNFFCISSRIENTGQFYGCFKIGPFCKSHSLTFANSLRRMLLTHQSKYVFNVAQIYGVEHEFSSLLGIRESVVDIVLNLEKLIFQTTKSLTKPKIAFMNFCGPGIVQGKHIHLPSNFKCINPLQYIATLEIDGQLMFKLFFRPTKQNEFVNKFIPFKNFFKKSKKKWWSNSIINSYCLNLFSKKFLKIQKKKKKTRFSLNNNDEVEQFDFFPERHQENFLFFQNSLNIVERVSYILQPLSSQIDQNLLNLKPPKRPIRFILKEPFKLNCDLKLANKNRKFKFKKKKKKKKKIILNSSEFIIFEIWTNGSVHPQTAILKAINRLLLEFFPYSLKISKIENQNFPRFKKIKRKYITSLSRSHFRKNLSELDISNFYFDLETLMFLKNNQIHTIIDFIIFLQENKDNWNSYFYNIDRLNMELKIQTIFLNFNKFIKKFA